MRNVATHFGTRLEQIDNDTQARDSSVNTSYSSILLRVLTSSEVPYSDQQSTATTTAFNNTTGTKGFYTSYNPDVGIQTAAVLGGILAFLVVYVIYRTKCRKRLLKAIDTCAMRLFPNEYAQEHGCNVIPRDRDQNRVQDICRKENAKVVWTEDDSKLPQKYADNTGKHGIHFKCSDVTGSCTHGCGDVGRLCGVDGTVMVDECSGDVRLKLPDCVSNSEQATAHWVQNVELLDTKDKEISGIILKIPPDLVHKSYRTRGHFLSASDYIDSDCSINISSRIKSLPLLLEGQRGFELYKQSHSSDRDTASSESSHVSAPETVLAADHKPQQLHIQHQSGTKVPLDICPIIRIQQYHSRSKRRLTSLCRTSSEDSVSSDSSNDPLLVVASHPQTSHPQTGNSKAKKTNSHHGNDVRHDNHVPEMKTGTNNVKKIYKSNSVVALSVHETKL